MDQQLCPLFWRDVCKTYFILINPLYWFSKVDLACIINRGLFCYPSIGWAHQLFLWCTCHTEIISLTRLAYWSIPRSPGLLWLCLTQCLGVAPFFLCMEYPNWNHHSCFNFLQWAFSLECALHPIPTDLPLQVLRNNPCQSFPIPRVKTYPSSSIVASVYRSLAHHSSPPAQLFPMRAKRVWPPFRNTHPWRGVLGVWFLNIL